MPAPTTATRGGALRRRLRRSRPRRKLDPSRGDRDQGLDEPVVGVERRHDAERVAAVLRARSPRRGSPSSSSVSRQSATNEGTTSASRTPRRAASASTSSVYGRSQGSRPSRDWKQTIVRSGARPSRARERPRGGVALRAVAGPVRLGQIAAQQSARARQWRAARGRARRTWRSGRPWKLKKTRSGARRRRDRAAPTRRGRRGRPGGRGTAGSPAGTACSSAPPPSSSTRAIVEPVAAELYCGIERQERDPAHAGVARSGRARRRSTARRSASRARPAPPRPGALQLAGQRAAVHEQRRALGRPDLSVGLGRGARPARQDDELEQQESPPGAAGRAPADRRGTRADSGAPRARAARPAFRG